MEELAGELEKYLKNPAATQADVDREKLVERSFHQEVERKQEFCGCGEEHPSC